jgi:hypothetical protein
VNWFSIRCLIFKWSFCQVDFFKKSFYWRINLKYLNNYHLVIIEYLDCVNKDLVLSHRFFSFNHHNKYVSIIIPILQLRKLTYILMNCLWSQNQWSQTEPGTEPRQSALRDYALTALCFISSWLFFQYLYEVRIDIIVAILRSQFRKGV